MMWARARGGTSPRECDVDQKVYNICLPWYSKICLQLFHSFPHARHLQARVLTRHRLSYVYHVDALLLLSFSFFSHPSPSGTRASSSAKLQGARRYFFLLLSSALNILFFSECDSAVLSSGAVLLRVTIVDRVWVVGARRHRRSRLRSRLRPRSRRSRLRLRLRLWLFPRRRPSLLERFSPWRPSLARRSASSASLLESRDGDMRRL